ncbi:hypothetical protein [Afipia sp. GAS231]|uniref:COG3904 family protein n=1 Tax=Afipia sp. GAS231 TaxID=1882747 RepID=UPI0012FCD40D|nr:hypothetical protein [Afipia sp. GAS231]
MPASQLFEIVVPDRIVPASKQISSKRQFSLYGIYLGLTVVLADYLFEWRGPKFKRWQGSGLYENIGYIIGAVAICLVLGFIIGGASDFAKGRSRRKSVLDPSTFQEPEIIPEIPLDPNRRNNFIARYWRGEYSLGISYWVFGFVGNIAVAVLTVGIVMLFQTDNEYEPRAIFGSLISVWLLIIAFVVWQVTGVWRSANRLIARRQVVGKRAGWATVAKVVVVLGLLNSISTFFKSGLPQLIESSRMAFLDDPDIPAYSIRVMRNGTEAEIAGGFKYGLTDDFSKVLKASRQIKVVHLDSTGGRVGEAFKLNNVLKAQGVDTYVSNGCYSACTIAFAAGRNRFIRKGAVLGFHAPAFPGMTKSELQDAALDQKRLFIDAGFNRKFVDKALSTPSSEMWMPSADLMAAADVITGLSDGTEFAVSGFGGDLSKEGMANALAKALPLLQTLKDRFPKHYDRVISTYYDDYIAGKTEAEAIVDARGKLVSIIATLRTLADDAVLVDLATVLADEYAALGDKSATLCYKFASGIGSEDNITAELPIALVNRDNEINRRIVETARNRQDVSATDAKDLWKKLLAPLAAKGVREEQLKLLLSDTAAAPSRYGEYCRASETFYREIARLQQREAAILMRFIFAEK